MSEVVNQIVASIDKMTVMELAELSKTLQEKYGVSAAVPMAAMAMPSAGGVAGAPAEAAEEKTEFNVILEAVGDKKIQVIKVIRELTNLGLKEAKELVDGAPNTVKEGVSKDEANTAKTKLEEVGATIKIT